jgi:WD40 repeat protein
VPIDGSPVRPFLSSTRNEFDPAASPVSTQYAFVTDRTGVLEIWLQNEEGYLQQPLVKASDFGAAAAYGLGSLSFSPDGRRLAFQRLDPGEAMGQWRKIWISPVSGGTPVQLGGEEGYQDAPTWSPDGEWIAYVLGKVGEWSLAKSRVGGGAPIKLLSDIPPFVARPQWSPDGRWILCETTDGLALVANDGSTSRLIGGSGWLTYNWAADGRQIYGLRLTDDLHHFMLATVDPLTGAERIINRNLGAVPQANQPIRGFSRLRDGGFLTSIARVRSDIYLIEGFRPFDSWWERVWPFAAGSR